MKSAVDLVYALWEKYKDRKVRVVAFPVTPTPICGLIYKPDCFMSRVFDHQALDNKEIVASAPTRNGPAFLSYLTLGDIMDVYDEEEGELEINNGAYCASTSFFDVRTFSIGPNGLISVRNPDERFASEADVHHLNITSSSCNAGSHFMIPNAPFLTSLVHLKQGLELDNGIEYFTKTECEALFPAVDFSRNEVVDKFVQSSKVHKVSWDSITGNTTDREFEHISYGYKANKLDPYDKHCLRELGKTLNWRKRNG